MLAKIYRWFFSSLANQLLFTYLLVITIALVVVTFWALVTIQSESITDLRNSLEVAAVHLALEIDNDLALESVAARSRIQAAVDRHATKLGVSITVVDSVGHVLADSAPTDKPIYTEQPAQPENLSKESEINEALAGIIAVCKRSSRATNSNWLYVAYPIRSAGVTSGVVRIGVPLTEVEQRLRRDLIVFLEIILATGTITVLISLWLAERVNRPVKEMSKMAKQISISGDISAFLPVSRQDEIGELSGSFNQMIDRLREQERLRQEFISNASHELKTPVMAIGSVVEALQAGAAENPELRVKFLGSLERMVERQGNLIRDLLDISRLDSTALTEWQDEVDLDQVISVSVDEVRPHAERKGIELNHLADWDGNVDMRISGNLIQLQRAIINLLTNAVNYTPSGGDVCVSTELEPRKVHIHIKDTGAGIHEDDIPHIFERFYRADKSRARAAGGSGVGGSGLGLAITHEIVVRHHGTIHVESKVGSGSTFTVTLPRRQQGSRELES